MLPLGSGLVGLLKLRRKFKKDVGWWNVVQNNQIPL
jgi:hypothetical protein